jgi:hypothetical protein
LVPASLSHIGITPTTLCASTHSPFWTEHNRFRKQLDIECWMCTYRVDGDGRCDGHPASRQRRQSWAATETAGDAGAMEQGVGGAGSCRRAHRELHVSCNRSRTLELEPGRAGKKEKRNALGLKA